ncbi:hypothetical protein D032_0647 [Vibrio parahaemolyticus V14/01]|nr:hypothetical protein D032_0647 [Vibrio parahaemolyticus V14/01]
MAFFIYVSLLFLQSLNSESVSIHISVSLSLNKQWKIILC